MLPVYTAYVKHFEWQVEKQNITALNWPFRILYFYIYTLDHRKNKENRKLTSVNIVIFTLKIDSCTKKLFWSWCASAETQFCSVAHVDTVCLQVALEGFSSLWPLFFNFKDHLNKIHQLTKWLEAGPGDLNERRDMWTADILGGSLSNLVAKTHFEASAEKLL